MADRLQDLPQEAVGEAQSLADALAKVRSLKIKLRDTEGRLRNAEAKLSFTEGRLRNAEAKEAQPEPELVRASVTRAVRDTEQRLHNHYQGMIEEYDRFYRLVYRAASELSKASETMPAPSPPPSAKDAGFHDRADKTLDMTLNRTRAAAGIAPVGPQVRSPDPDGNGSAKLSEGKSQ